MAKIEVGCKVVCIDGDFSEHPNIHQHFTQLPIEGKIYTVREIVPVGKIFTEKAGIVLEEVRNHPIYFPSLFGKREPAFRIDRFVPLSNDEVEILEKKELVNVN